MLCKVIDDQERQLLVVSLDGGPLAGLTRCLGHRSPRGNLWKVASKSYFTAIPGHGTGCGKPQVGHALVGDARVDCHVHGAIAAHLDLLTGLGMISRMDTAESPRWHRPQAMGA